MKRRAPSQNSSREVGDVFSKLDERLSRRESAYNGHEEALLFYVANDPHQSVAGILVKDIRIILILQIRGVENDRTARRFRTAHFLPPTVLVFCWEQCAPVTGSLQAKRENNRRGVASCSDMEHSRRPLFVGFSQSLRNSSESPEQHDCKREFSASAQLAKHHAMVAGALA
jgi:hypothetical protein